MTLTTPRTQQIGEFQSWWLMQQLEWIEKEDWDASRKAALQIIAAYEAYRKVGGNYEKVVKEFSK